MLAEITHTFARLAAHTFARLAAYASRRHSGSVTPLQARRRHPPAPTPSRPASDAHDRAEVAA